MIQVNKILANYDARISKISILPENKSTRVVMESKMYNESSGSTEGVSIVFTNVAAIDFRINYFDNVVGSEASGLYQIEDKRFVEKLVKEIFERRKEIYLLEGDYDYNETEHSDMLNTLDIYDDFFPEIHNYCAYVQNVDAGVYIVVAKAVQIIH